MGRPLIFVLLAALIGWRLYARIRRSVGRQRLSAARPLLTVILVPIVIAALLVSPAVTMTAVWSLLAAAVLGAGLGAYALRLTRFEATPAGLYYTPSAHLGIALSILLVCRVAYRLAMLNSIGYAGAARAPGAAGIAGTAGPAGLGAGATPHAAIGGSPVTLAIVGALCGYYVAYAAGLLIWRRRVLAGGTTQG